jgi:hypothetical protein
MTRLLIPEPGSKQSVAETVLLVSTPMGADEEGLPAKIHCVGEPI